MAKELFSINPEAHGGGPIVYSWHPDASFVASVGQSRVTHIWDRYGAAHARIPPTNGVTEILALEWDCDGEILAILQAGSGVVQLWDRHSQRVSPVDTGEKALTFLAWSKTGPELAIGSGKGNLYLYDKRNQQIVPIKGKHTKKITCGAWNRQNKLALASADKQITISNNEGDNLETISIANKSEPSQLTCDEQKTDDSSVEVVSVNLGGKNIYMCSLVDIDNPIELAFMPKYGSIVNYKWFGDGYIMIGFSSGYVNAVSTHMSEIGTEIFNQKLFHQGEVADMAISFENQWTAIAGDNAVYMLNMREADFRPIPSQTLQLPDGGYADKLSWTQGGNVLSVSTKQGALHSYLMKVPCLCAGWDTKVAFLASLRELCVTDSTSNAPTIKIALESEPAFVAVGPKCVACGMNNRVWYYSTETRQLIREKEYHGTVSQVVLSADYAAVRVDGQVILHPYDPKFNVPAGRDDKTFPAQTSQGGDKNVTWISMTNDFLVYGTSRGFVHYFYIKQWADVNEFRHDNGVRKVFPNTLGTRAVLIDDTHQGLLYNPVNDVILPLPQLASSTDNCLWDSADTGVLVTCANSVFSTYVYHADGLHGPTINKLSATTPIPSGATPISVYNGVVTCQESGGGITNITLATHDAINQEQHARNPQMYTAVLNQNLELGRLKECWDVAYALNSAEVWQRLATAAMETLDIELALRIYRQQGDAAMVLGLEKVLHIEDSKLMAGHVAMILEDYSTAQEFFLASARPLTALEMRRDLLHWEQSLKLARTLAPEQIPFISRAYAQQLEFKGEHTAALTMYENALRKSTAGGLSANVADGDDSNGFGEVDVEEHTRLAQAGVARTTIRTGDVPRGISLAQSSENSTLQRECGAILEGMRQWQDAAMLYETAGAYEKAAEIHITTKNFAQAAPLMSSISTPKLHLLYAQAKEAEGEYVEACAAYEKARDLDAVVRLNLDHMRNPQRAMQIVRETRSTEGAGMISSYCKKAGNIHAAIEFLVMAKQNPDAFEHATTHDAMDTYATCIGADGTPDEYIAIARFYETKSENAKAGNFYRKANDFPRALRLFLQCGDAEVNSAIDVVGEARSEMLTNTLIDFLMGESDGVPKDPKFIFRLYMALGKYPEAVRTANIIARQEQELGNYKPAHDLLYDTFRDLEADKKRVPRELYNNLMLLHSYILVKYLIPLGDHKTAARMLLRVAKNITRFPAHVVPILTSTVVECMKAGLKKSALEHAQTLMRPEHRSLISETYKRKIEGMVRKGAKTADETHDPDEATAPCPSCSTMIPETSLDCHSCKLAIPFCIVSGKHIVADDYTVCPSCRFEATHSSFQTFIEKNGSCPMCDQEIVLASVRKMEWDPKVSRLT